MQAETNPTKHGNMFELFQTKTHVSFTNSI